jgi:hypothetical protein
VQQQAIFDKGRETNKEMLKQAANDCVTRLSQIEAETDDV